VRLSDTVLGRSGGSGLSAPGELRWLPEDEAERERVLAPVEGHPALVKDPRTLLCWGFWAATPRPLALIGTVRHPLAVARSMVAWRRLPLDDGLRLWLAHAQPLLELADAGAVPLVDVDAEPAAFLAAVAAVVMRLGLDLDPAAMAAHYDPALLHHNDTDAGGTVDAGLLASCATVHRGLLGHCAAAPRRRGQACPWAALAAAQRGEAGPLHAALAASADPTSILVPACAELLRVGQAQAVIAVVDSVSGLDVRFSGLLLGKALLALGRAAEAVAALERAVSAPEPFWEARSLLAHALHGARRRDEAQRLLVKLADEAVHPQQCLATAAEWAWQQRTHDEALALFARAISGSAAHRRGRLRCRRAELLCELGRDDEAAQELRTALDEDPAYGRARELLARLPQ
jgi:tetratricopeptide (TPR) repeat protein